MSFSTFLQSVVSSEAVQNFKENHNFGSPKQIQKTDLAPTTPTTITTGTSTFDIKEWIPMLAVGGIILIYMLKKKK